MGYSFWLAARVLLYAPSHRQDSTYHGLCYTSRGALATAGGIWHKDNEKDNLLPLHGLHFPIIIYLSIYKDLTCTFRASCYSARLSWVLVLTWVNFFTETKIQLAADGSLNIHHPTVWIAHTTAIVEHWLKREVAQYVHVGSMSRPITPRGDIHGTMSRRINPSWGRPIELFLVPASAPRLV